MKILIVSGFLGAGKTTFIKSLVENTDKNFAIFENEFANVGVDASRLKSENTNVNVWEMTERCICCEAKGDFRASVLTIANTINPDYLLIEPTGVAKLNNILSNLQTIEYERIEIMSPITIVDGINYRESILSFSDIFNSQLNYARTIIVSKTEGMSDDEIACIFKEIKSKANANHSVNISIKPVNQSKENIRAFYENLLHIKLDGSTSETAESLLLPDTYSLKEISIDCMEKFLLFLEDVVRGFYGEIIRSKGTVKIKERLFRFDTVNERYTFTEESGIDSENANSNAAIFIGHNINKDKINLLFNSEQPRKYFFYRRRKYY